MNSSSSWNQQYNVKVKKWIQVNSKVYMALALPNHLSQICSLGANIIQIIKQHDILNFLKNY